ncbi:NADPH:quinone reductase-like Zn-dependent oxidoreductase [Prauserella shujinwangii]|uniref:NADPH:quinone reductase-like Zn-dependent oxidoreductase n=1 Tax=Prauserella shujinwangii TaxID=1453103 RepID=A0A2T0LYK1_9PSEU|nr:NAD(P)-dependent alcohol dehydrogenase [Prauserella shujinwangii]PRX49184.1 NADPH:quinone reductase-like Zn-dependent oxidoreductase [Prauserella shujinwangii]
MKAIVQDGYGPADVLRLGDIPKPVPGDGEVLLSVRAAGVDPGVWHLMTGLPYLVRVMGFGLRAPKVRVRGRDVAGVVAAVGANVTGFRPGDEVFGTCEGSFAEYACARADRIAPKPANLGFVEAAAVPVSGGTALQAVRDCGRVRPGHRVLVIGAGGGVGSFAVQLAAAFGGEVTGVCGPDKAELVRSLGAVDVIDYTREDLAERRHRYDVILDTAGNRPLARLRRALAPRGALVIVGGEGGDRWIGGFDRALRAGLLSPFTRQRLRGLVAKENSADLTTLRELAESGAFAPVVGRTYALAEAPDAIRELHKGHTRGKLVVTVGS